MNKLREFIFHKLPVRKASLLVFEDNGTPVKAIGISGDYLRGEADRVSWPADVMLKPLGTGALQLTLPLG